MKKIEIFMSNNPVLTIGLGIMFGVLVSNLADKL